MIASGFPAAAEEPSPEAIEVVQLVPAGPLEVQPGSMMLTARRQPKSILVMAQSADGLSIDLTGQASYTSADPAIARVDALGWVTPVASGKTTIAIEAAGKKAAVAVECSVPQAERPYSFQNEVMPVLSKGGCNMGACHGYSLGKNGFKLSLRGADPEQDFAVITQEFFSRRINRHNPPASLLVAKPVGDLPHKGGVRFEPGSLSHQLLLGWIAEGAGHDPPGLPTLVSVRMHPAKVVVPPGAQHQLQLLAEYSDGSVRDVTRLGVFTSNTPRIAEVDADGLVTALELGETAIVARFERKFAVTGTVILKPVKDFQPTPVPTDNPIDTAVVEKLNWLKIKPSEAAGDEMFLRRVYLDLIGVQPKPEEVRAFLADADPQKRTRVIDGLFARSEFVDHWSLKWGDLLQNSRTVLSDPAVFAFREWIRGAVASNMPLDQFAREILTAQAGMSDNPASAYFVVSKDTNDTAERVTEVFCGVRMLCARCHPHPFENWTQVDYYGLTSFFGQVTTKRDPLLAADGRAKIVTLNLAAPYSVNPRTGRPQPPRFLGGVEPEVPSGTDRRVLYAAWLTAPDNPFFASGLANRIWSYFFHRGVVDPVDDVRTTNPPINPELLDVLTQELVEHKFDARHLMRLIVASQTYQRSSVPNALNAHDDLNFSRAVPRRVPAEALLDSLVQATGVPERFAGAPANFTAAQLPDAVNNEFLNLFGKPQRMEACECERDDGSNMLQSLHLINGDSILSRVQSGSGRVAQLLAKKLPREQLVEELYLWSLARRPTADEMKVSLEFFASYEEAKFNEACQDLMWALLNSRDFLLVN